METTHLKPAKLWWLVSTYYVTAFIGASILMGLLGVALTTVGGAGMPFDSADWSVVYFVLYLCLLACTTWYAGQFLKKRYVLQNPKKIIHWSMYVHLALAFAMAVIEYMEFGYMPEFLTIGSLLVELAVFYVVSKKFLRA